MPEWDNFQLDRYAKVIMFGEQVKADQWMTILLWWVWTYVNKEGPLTGDTIRNLRGGHVMMEDPSMEQLSHEQNIPAATNLNL